MDKQKAFEWMDKLIDAFELMHSDLITENEKEISCLTTYADEGIHIWHPDRLADLVGIPYVATREEDDTTWIVFHYKGYVFRGLSNKKYKYTLEEAQNIALLK